MISFLVAACLLESGETGQSVDFAIKSQLDEMVQSSKVRFFNSQFNILVL